MALYADSWALIIHRTYHYGVRERDFFEAWTTGRSTRLPGATSAPLQPGPSQPRSPKRSVPADKAEVPVDLTNEPEASPGESYNMGISVETL